MNRHRALLVIDARPLHRAAWREIVQVRKRLKKSTDELHAFENIDAPAYESWLHRTFPVSLTALRELSEELITKSAKVAAVELQVMMEGGNPRRHWRELNAEESRRRNDPAFDFGDKDNPGNRKRARHSFGSDPAAEFFDEDLDENLPWGESPKAPPVGEGARDVYRRLVQRLHPDRGGEWTAARKRLWHEVQEAWAAGDFDWLARLEVEWDSTDERLGPDSALGRLLAAIDELNAARRDADSKVREYRGEPGWKFTQNEAKRPALVQRVKAMLETDLYSLRMELARIRATIARWERESRRPAKRSARHIWD